MSRYIDYDALDYKNWHMIGKSSDFIDGVVYMAERIEEAPSIDLADYVPKDFHDKTCEAMAQRHAEEIQRLMPKRGEWLDYEIPLEDGGSMPIQVCNLCKTFYPLAYTGGGHHFCPNCGASMRESEGE